MPTERSASVENTIGAKILAIGCGFWFMRTFFLFDVAVYVLELALPTNRSCDGGNFD